ncbi:hypothetical protein PFISCL1PPCAC_15925, partial [Pristionchus fissidentatus]
MRELRAVEFAVSTFEREWHNLSIVFYGDNQSAMIILRKGSMKRELNEIARRVEKMRERMGASFKFFWIPREMNAEADLASRDVDTDDWSLQGWVFDQATNKWGSPDIDLFADENNAKCVRFVSRLPCRGAAAVDAFSLPFLWTGALLWCVPPTALLCKTLAWMRGVRARGILGLPYWTSHPVFPRLFLPDSSPPFVKDYLMFPEGTQILNPGSCPIGELLRSIYGTVGQTDPSLQPLLVQSIEGAKASSTMRVYSGSFDKLRAYARERGLDPACPTSLVIFSLRQVQEGKSLATLKTLSASFNHFVASPPPLVSQLLSYVHQSSRRQTTVSHHGHVPRSHVDRLVQYASQNPHDLPVLRAAMGAALAFAALLRVSELVSLRWDDLNWSEGRLGVRVRRAKNDQFGEGRETFVSIEDPSPVLSLFQQYRSLTASSPWLFPSLTIPELPIKPDSFRQDLTQLCSRAGVER